MSLFRTVVACLLALGFARAEAPGRYLFKTYGPEQGFVEPGLTSIAQDSEGFIWIGADSGLVRYDGVAFRKWTAEDGLASTAVNRVLRRRGGGIWVITEGGLMKFHKGVFTPVLHQGRTFRPIRGSAVDLDGDGVLWALGVDGLYRQGGEGMERVAEVPSGQGHALACRTATASIFAVVGGQVWERRKEAPWVRYTTQDGLPVDGIETLAVDGEGRLWVVGRRLLRYQDPGEAAFRDASSWLPAPPFASCIISREPDGTVGIPTNAGLLRLRGDDHEVIDQAAGLPCRWTASSLRDREGNLWVVGPTVYRQLGRGQVRTFTAEDGLPSDLVWQVFRDRSGRLFAGTSEGLALLGERGWSRVPGTDGLNVTSLVQDDSGALLIGSTNAPLRTLEPRGAAATENFHRSLRAGGLAPPQRSQSVACGRDGILWLADPSRGVFRIDSRTRESRLDYGPAQAGIPTFVAWHLVADGEGRIWGATSAGLILHDEGGWHRFGQAQGLKVDPLNGIALAQDGTAWVLYREPRGAARVAYAGGAIQVLESLDAGGRLASNVVYAGGVDARGRLWLGSDRGVEIVSGPSTFLLGRGSGLAGDDCSQNAILVDRNQDVWVGTSTGLSHVLDGRRPRDLPPLVTTITQVTRGRHRADVQGPVSHADATLEFRFASQTYVNEKAVVYQVRLGGLEDDWRSTDVPQARYAALPGGRYTFEVRAAYPGMAFGPAATFAFEVLPPWWRTWWFTTLEVLTALGAVTQVMNWRLRTLARQKERLAGLVDKATGDLLKANHALEKANLALKAQSLSDPLTGLHNRRFLSVVVDDDTAKVQRSYRDWTPGQALPNNDLLFLMVDLDHFKVVNDNFGHHVGDQVLEIVAQVLRKAARETDGVIRWGGEEFLVMARNSTRAEAPFLAERIRSLMAEQSLTLESGEVVRWTCSVGYAAYPFSLRDTTWMGWEKVVEIADACLYLAKRAGRNAWAGAEALEGLDRAAHGPRLPWELSELQREGVVDVVTSLSGALPPRP
ncbi:ligand-binding sensor domain-containing diguanylate cyclase [Mesoterricola silvestris]|uniref:diguanylate cyclase n=1 Tax=Mesoterricola silvestris TaxID=2927979 RepID=A0AA48GW06_9BACT|nr:ligand-binding sensor domain-containing diguanylate cyclase [Mesoterricola silvestris]BDU71368.1 GGDEF domain-containing protein [Mesoterricola silvestris]